MPESIFQRRRRMMREVESGAVQGTRNKTAGSEDLVGSKKKKDPAVKVRTVGQED